MVTVALAVVLGFLGKHGSRSCAIVSHEFKAWLNDSTGEIP
jgi:hypothetical protein